MPKQLTCLKDYQNRIRTQLGAYLDISKWPGYTLDAAIREALREASTCIPPIEQTLDVSQGLDENNCPIPNTGVIDVSEINYREICAVATYDRGGQCCFDSSQANFRETSDGKLYLGCCACVGTTACIRYRPILCLCDLDGAEAEDHNIPPRFIDTIIHGAIGYALRIRARQLSESRNELEKSKQETSHCKHLLEMAKTYIDNFQTELIDLSEPKECIVWNIDIGDRQCYDIAIC